MNSIKRIREKPWPQCSTVPKLTPFCFDKLLNRHKRLLTTNKTIQIHISITESGNPEFPTMRKLSILSHIWRTARDPPTIATFMGSSF